MAASLFLSGCGEEQATELEAPLRQVRSIVVDSGTGVFERSFSGTLHASQETSLSFKVSGTIEDIAVEVGDKITKGDVLATLDTSSYSLEAQKAQASLTEAQSEFRNAKADYDRTKKLYEAGNSSRSDLDNARTASDSAAASVQSVRKSLEIARLDLSYTKLKAEDDCAIASVDADEGENVAQGTQIFFATCGDQLEVKIDIPESIISNIKKDMLVSVSFPAIADKVFKGKVFEVGVSSVAGGTTFPVTVVLTESDAYDLKAGLSADVTFAIDTRINGKQAAPVLPAFAIGEDQNGRFVFTVEPTSGNRAMVKRVPVQIGEIQQNGIEILQGIKPGMRVVTAGVSVLRDGMEVKVSE
ncbi:MAG: efflux RND transporter periplasmic adaptor subunit [Pseudomonadota bacterium]